MNQTTGGKIEWQNIATTGVLALISVIGIVGNSLVIWVFRGQAKKYRTSGILILFLAITDLIVCMIDIPLTLSIDIWQVSMNDPVCRTFGGIKGFLILLSPDILLVIAIERFLVICYTPGIAFRQKHTCIAIFFIITIGAISAVPTALITGNVKMNDTVLIMEHINAIMPDSTEKESNGFGKICWTDTRFLPRESYYIYRIIICVLFVIILLLITVFYTLIFAYVCSRQAKMYERYGPTVKGSWIYLMGTSQQGSGDVQNNNNKLELVNACNNNENTARVQSNESTLRENYFHAQGKSSNNNLLEVPLEQNKNAQNYDFINILKEDNDVNNNCDTNMPIVPSATTRERQSKEEFIANRNRKRPHVRTAKTLGIISVAFMISYSPHILTTMLRDLKHAPAPGRFGHHDNIATLMFYLYFLSSALNPFIYSCTNNVFKAKISFLLQTIFGICGGQIRNPAIVLSTSSNTDERKVRNMQRT